MVVLVKARCWEAASLQTCTRSHTLELWVGASHVRARSRTFGQPTISPDSVAHLSRCRASWLPSSPLGGTAHERLIRVSASAVGQTVPLTVHDQMHAMGSTQGTTFEKRRLFSGPMTRSWRKGVHPQLDQKGPTVIRMR